LNHLPNKRVNFIVFLYTINQNPFLLKKTSVATAMPESKSDQLNKSVCIHDYDIF